MFKAGRITKAPLWRLLIHDWSKLTPIEWVAYREYFYGKAPYIWNEDYGCGVQYIVLGEEAERKWREKVDRDFLYAWLHHQHRNKHHWQYWALKCDNGRLEALDIPEKYVREMVADWVGAGYAINGKVEVHDWYLKNRQHMKLSDKTQKLVEELILMFPDGSQL